MFTTKQLRSFIFFMLLISIIIINYSTTIYYPSDPPNNKCGLYGTQPTCSSCHSPGSGGTGSTNISISGNPSSYALNTTYSITVSVTQAAAPIYGFEMAAVNASNTNAGSFTNIATTSTTNGTVLGNSISFIRQSSALASGIWTFNWKSPTSDVGNITFYLAGLAANNNGSKSGDYVYTKTLTLTSPCVPPTATLTTTSQTLCNDVTNFDLNSVVAAGSAPGTWSGTGVSSGTTFNANLAGVGTHTLTFTTGSGSCSNSKTLSATVKLKPNPILTGKNIACVGSTEVYSIPAIAGTTYAWTVSGGTIISGGQSTSNTVTILWTQANGTVSVTQTNP